MPRRRFSTDCQSDVAASHLLLSRSQNAHVPLPVASCRFGLAELRRTVRGENWPGWRGPRGDGTSWKQDVPTHWSPEQENVAWKVECPARGTPRPSSGTTASSWSPATRRPKSGSCSASTAHDGPTSLATASCCSRRWNTSTGSTASPPARRPPTASWSTSRFSIATKWSWRPTTSPASSSWLVRPGRVLQHARLLQLPGAVRRHGDRQRRPRRRRLPRGARRSDRRTPSWKTPAREQDPQLRHADHPRDRRPHADDPLGQQVRGQLRSARRLAALDHRRADRAVRGLGGLQRRVCCS